MPAQISQQLLSTFNITVSETQHVGLVLNGIKGGNNNNQYWRVAFNGGSYHDIFISGAAGSSQQGEFAEVITGSGNLQISIYALDYSTGGLDSFEVDSVAISYF